MSERETYDFIIVGSGTSGGVAAYHLQAAGARCLLVESGAYFTAKDYPKQEADYAPQLFWGGGVEYNTRCDLAFLRGRCVGGGSVVNAALMDRFDAIALDDWRDLSGIPFFSEAALDEDYTAAEQNISLQTIPEAHRNRNALHFIKAMDALGYVWEPLKRCQSDCAIEEGNDCIACLGGCHRDSKQSTLATYIPRAVKLGLTVVADFHVQRVEHHRDRVEVFGLHQKSPRTFTARKAVLAGGALGNSHLLLNSGFKERLPALGTGFAMHPQFMNFAVMEDPVDAHKGVLQGVKSQDPGFRQAGFKLENVFAPPISVAVLFQKTGRDLLDFMKKYRYLACMEVAVRDENTGTLFVDRRGRLRIEKALTAQDHARAREGLAVARSLLESLRPREIVQSSWSFGLHLMGGCALGQDPQHSVVNEAFEVHGHPNLHIADSSTFPNAPGINPGLTIMALSRRMAKSLESTS